MSAKFIGYRNHYWGSNKLLVRTLTRTLTGTEQHEIKWTD